MKIGLFGINMARVDAPDTLLPLMKRHLDRGACDDPPRLCLRLSL